jgi:hypothetical protein
VPEIKIRDLTTKDIFTVAKILGKVTKGARGEMLMLISGKSKDISPANLGLTLFQVLFTDAEDDIKDWLADLAGMKIEELDKASPTALLDIVDQLIVNDGIKDFLSRASLLVTKITPKDSGKTSTQSNAGTDGQTTSSTPSNSPVTSQ